MIISASWLSRTGEGNGTLNLRGVATLLALADFFKGALHTDLYAINLIFKFRILLMGKGLDFCHF